MKLSCPHGLLCALLLAADQAEATQVDWNGLPFSTNLTSTGQPWDDTWVAELGSFSGSFTPTSGNTAAWAASWRAASRSVFQPATSYFAGSYFYDANGAPFLAGVRAYIWLFNPNAPQGEWMLLTNPAWTWPAGSAFDPFITTWASSDATHAVVGQLPAAEWSLKSAEVLNSALPPLPIMHWKEFYFTAAEISNPAVSGNASDPDGDGASNVIEYAAGTLPRRASSFPPPAGIFLYAENAQLFGAARLKRSTRVIGYSWQAEASDGLSLWGAGLSSVGNFPWELTVRRTLPITVARRGYIRFKVVP